MRKFVSIEEVDMMLLEVSCRLQDHEESAMHAIDRARDELKEIWKKKSIEALSRRLEKLPDNVSFVKNGGWTGRRAPRWSENWIQVDGEDFETTLAKLENEMKARSQAETSEEIVDHPKPAT